MSTNDNNRSKLSATELAAAILSATAADRSDLAAAIDPKVPATVVDSVGLISHMAEGPHPDAGRGPVPSIPSATADHASTRDLPPAEELPPVGWQAPLIDLLAALARKLWLVFLLLGIGITAGIYLLQHTKPYYRATCVALLLPREKPTLDVAVSTSSIETGMDGAKRESSGPLMLPPNTDLYTTILVSRPVLQAIAAKFGHRLQRTEELTDDLPADDVLERLQQMLKITGTEAGMITIEVTANNSVLAADMANEFLLEMERASKAIERQLILRQSGFLDGAKRQVAAELLRDEQGLADFYARHGVIDVAAQAADILRMKREQEQEMARLEQEMLARLANFTENDDTVRSMRLRLEQHRHRIDALGQRYLSLNGEEQFGKVQIEFDGLRERVRYKRDLLATISTQQSVFQIRAEQPAGSVAILRSAMAPSLPAGPSKQLTLGVPVIVALLAAIVLILLTEQWTGSKHDPYIARRIREIRMSLRRRPARQRTEV